MFKDLFKQEKKAKTVEDYQKMAVPYEKLLSIAYYYGGGNGSITRKRGQYYFGHDEQLKDSNIEN